MLRVCAHESYISEKKRGNSLLCNDILLKTYSSGKFKIIQNVEEARIAVFQKSSKFKIVSDTVLKW